MPNQPIKFSTKNWFEVNGDARETHTGNTKDVEIAGSLKF